jgi:hypothetical protein
LVDADGGRAAEADYREHHGASAEERDVCDPPGLAIVFLGRVIGALGLTYRDEAIIEIEMIDTP